MFCYTDSLLVKYISIILLTLLSFLAHANEIEECKNSLKDLFKDSTNEKMIQKLLGLQGKLTLHRLAWATTYEDKNKRDFKLEVKINEILNKMDNQDPEFIEAKKQFEKNQLSRTALARIMPYIKNTLNAQNGIDDPILREKFILQDSDVKLLAILAEKEVKLDNGLFDHRLFSNQNSDNSILNFTKIIDSSMRDRPISLATQQRFKQQIIKLSGEIEDQLKKMNISEACFSFLTNACNLPQVSTDLLDKDTLELIQKFNKIDKQAGLKYGDFWLHVGGKKSDQIHQTKRTKTPPEIKDPPVYKKPSGSFDIDPNQLEKEKLYLEKLIDKILNNYPYFLTRDDLRADPELIFSLIDAIESKKTTFVYRDADGNLNEYKLPENYNRSNYIEEGEEIINSFNSSSIAPMDRKLNLPHVQMIDEKKRELRDLQKLVPSFTETKDLELKEKLKKEFHYHLVACKYGKSPQDFFDFRGAIYQCDNGKKLERTKDQLLAFKIGEKQKEETSPLDKFKALPDEQKNIVFDSSINHEQSYIYNGNLYQIGNTLIDKDEILKKKTKLSPLSFDSKLQNINQLGADPQPVTESKAKVVKAIVEGESAVVIGPNIVNPLTLEIYSFKDQEKIALDFQTQNKIPRTNLLGLDADKRKIWVSSILNAQPTFIYKGNTYNSLDAEKVVDPISRTPSGKTHYDSKAEIIDRINLLDDENLIIEFHKKFKTTEACEFYTIVSKKDNRLTVYNKDGQSLFSKEILLGKERGDKRTIFYNDKYSNAQRKTNGKTAAGVFYSYAFRDNKDNQYYENYNNNLLALVTEKGVFDGPLNKDKEYETVLAMHQIPIGYENRYSALKNNNPEDNRISNGCLNLSQMDFEEYKKKFPNPGCPVYILPEELDANGNPISRMKIINDKISFTPVDSDSCPKNQICNNDYYYSIQSEDKIKEIEISIFNQEQTNNPFIRDFTQTLTDNKKVVANELGLSNDEYNDLAELSYAIMGIESGFGTEKRYQIKEGALLKAPAGALQTSPSIGAKLLGFMMSTFSQDLGQSVVDAGKLVEGNDSSNSRGLTQIKDVTLYTKKYDFSKHITEDNLTDPKNAALATMIVLKEMSRELTSLQTNHNNVTRENKAQFLYYIYNGSTSQIRNGGASPELNVRAREIKEYLDQIHIYEKD